MKKYSYLSETFEDVDFSIIKEVLFFDGWQSYEECGGHLIFLGIDDSLQMCEYGYSVMVEDNTNLFVPVEITEERFKEILLEFEKTKLDYPIMQ